MPLKRSQVAISLRDALVVERFEHGNGVLARNAHGIFQIGGKRGALRFDMGSHGFDELVECGTMAAAKEKGLIRSEGKDYVIKDGDIVLFRFNV